MSRKSELKELRDRLNEYSYDLEAADKEIGRLKARLALHNEAISPRPRPSYSLRDWCVSATLDLLPFSDWKRLSLDNSWSAKQVAIGPIRIDCYIG